MTEVQIAGTSQFIQDRTLIVQDALFERSTARFVVIDETGEETFQKGQPVVILDDSSEREFAGVIDTARRQRAWPEAGFLHKIRCADNHYFADKRIVARVLQDTLAGDIVSEIVRLYLGEEGIVGRHLDDETTTEGDWNGGTLVDTVATGAGDLELDLPTLAGTWTSPAISLTPVDTYSSGTVSWSETLNGKTVTVEVSTDGGSSWSAQTNGGAIPGLSADQDVAGMSVLVRVTLTSDDTGVTPQVHDLTVSVRSDLIDDGPTVNEAVFNYITAAKALDKLADESNFWWRIDHNKRLTFGARTKVAAPFSVDEGDVRGNSIRVFSEAPKYRNKQFIKNIRELTDPQTESYVGDGETQSFPVGFPIAKEPTITVNGNPQTVGIKGVESTQDWFWSKGDNVVTQNLGDIPITGTDTLAITYQGSFDAVLINEDTVAIAERQSIEGGGSGKVENVFENFTRSDQSAAIQSATALLEKFATIGDRVEFVLEAAGLEPGQILTVDFPGHGIDEVEMLIESVDLERDGAVTWYRVTATSGPEKLSWTRLFAELGEAPQFIEQVNIDETSILIGAQPIGGSWSWDETMNITTAICAFPSSSLFPSGSEFPC